MLNIACGSRYDRRWQNIDFHAHSPDVRKVNILLGLPFKDNSFDVIYTSHFIEHLSQKQASFILRECYRVLKRNGIMRVVVPDLENICSEYLLMLNAVQKNDANLDKYKWSQIELLDQLVRVNSGGEMLDFFQAVQRDRNTATANYILKRTGDDLLNDALPAPRSSVTVGRVKNWILYKYLRGIRMLVPRELRDVVFVSTAIGERHQWMYDKFSMARLLTSNGFRETRALRYDQSEIENFNQYFLDNKEDGSSYKGEGSLYMEARK